MGAPNFCFFFPPLPLSALALLLLLFLCRRLPRPAPALPGGGASLRGCCPSTPAGLLPPPACGRRDLCLWWEKRRNKAAALIAMETEEMWLLICFLDWRGPKLFGASSSATRTRHPHGLRPSTSTTGYACAPFSPSGRMARRMRSRWVASRVRPAAAPPRRRRPPPPICSG